MMKVIQELWLKTLTFNDFTKLFLILSIIKKEIILVFYLFLFERTFKSGAKPNSNN